MRTRRGVSMRSLAALALWVPALALSAPAGARPIPPIHPGGVEDLPDSIVILYPVFRSPSLLSLRAAPLYGGTGFSERRPAPETLVRVAPGDLRATPGPAAPSGAASSADAFVLSGTKSLSIEIGRGRDASLHQSLDLTLRGRVGDDVEVAAALRDQALPFEAGGESRALEDLDRLRVSVRSTHAEATLGDFRLDGGGGELARVTRQLEGVRGGARVGGATWDVIAGSARGERRALEFRGEDGKQGPYALLARTAGVAPAGVVAGSETVWLDGAKLARGANADYVIDNEAGTLTFHVRRLITAQSRIAVDFEESAVHYRRNLYAAFTQAAAPGAGRWYAGYAVEGDDPGRAVDAALSDADRRALRDLGDSVTTVAAGGPRFVGAGLGSYAWDESDPANARWIYVGPGRGDHEVAFARVGAGRGAYGDTLAADGTTFYRYLGRNLGSYAPGEAMPAPSRRSLVDLGGSGRAGDWLTVDGEVARSGYDRNALSPKDDADNAGLAARFGMRVEPRRLALWGRSLGTLRLSAGMRSKDERFEGMDRIEAGFEGERWNQGAATGSERRQDLALEYAPAARVRLTGEIGRRALGGGSRATRRAASAELRAGVAGAVRWEEAENALGAARGLRSRLIVELARERGVIQPRARASEERIRGAERDSLSSRRSREVLLALGVAPASAVKLRGAYTGRTDAGAAEGAPDLRALSAAWEYGVSVRGGPSLSLDAGWTRRTVDGASSRSASDLAQLALLAGRPDASVSSELRYDVTQLREPSLNRRVVEVGAGAGSYDSFGNPRLGGGYELVASSGEPSDRSRATVTFRLDAYPGRTAARAGRATAWRGLGSSTLLRIESLSTLSLARVDHAFDPADYLADATTLRGGLDARQTFSFAPSGRPYDARIELGARRDLTGDLENLRVRRDSREAILRVRAPLVARLRAAASATFDRTTHAARRTDAPDRYRSLARGAGGDLDVSRALGPAWTVALVSRYRRDADITSGGLQQAFSLGPSARCAVGDRLRLDGGASWGRTTRRGTYAPAGLYVAAAEGRRLQGSLLGEYRLRDQVSLTLTWNGDQVAGRRTVHAGRLELRSYF